MEARTQPPKAVLEEAGRASKPRSPVTALKALCSSITVPWFLYDWPHAPRRRFFLNRTHFSPPPFGVALASALQSHAKPMASYGSDDEDGQLQIGYAADASRYKLLQRYGQTQPQPQVGKFGLVPEHAMGSCLMLTLPAPAGPGSQARGSCR